MQKLNLRKWIIVVGILLLVGLLLVLVESGVFKSNTTVGQPDSSHVERLR